MNDTEQLKSELENLTAERDRLMRGLGQRYSRRFKDVPYDKTAHKSPKKYEEFSKLRRIKTQRNIKKTKNRLTQISDDIADIKQKIKQVELQNFSSSKKFGPIYSRALGSLRDAN